MKRYITLVILVAALTLSFCGCKQKTEYNAFVCGFSDSVPEIEPKLEYTKWMTDEGNKKIIIEIKNKLGEFIEKDAGDIIRKYMLDRINRMEEVLNGKVY